MTFRSDSKFRHSRSHRDKDCECCKPPRVPSILRDFLQALPESVLEKTCGQLGHPSFWLGPGFRYRCVCNQIWYHD